MISLKESGQNLKNGWGLVELVVAKILYVFYVKHACKPHPAKLGLFLGMQHFPAP